MNAPAPAPVSLPAPDERGAALVAALTGLSVVLGAQCDIFTENVAELSGLSDEHYAGIIGYVRESAALAEGPARSAAVSTCKGLIAVGPSILPQLVAFAPRPVARSAAARGPAEVTRADNVFNIIGARLWSAFLALDLTDLPAAAEVAPADSILTGDPIPAVIMERITSADPSARLSGLSAITAARVKIPDGAGATYTPDGADGAAHGSNAVDKAGKVKNVSGGLAFIFEAHRPAGKVKTAPADTSATSATSAAPADTSATSAPAALTSAPAAE